MSEFSDLLTGEFTLLGVTVQNSMLLPTMVLVITITAMRKTIARPPGQNPSKTNETLSRAYSSRM